MIGKNLKQMTKQDEEKDVDKEENKEEVEETNEAQTAIDEIEKEFISVLNKDGKMSEIEIEKLVKIRKLVLLKSKKNGDI